jgi:hypothetical protein
MVGATVAAAAGAAGLAVGAGGAVPTGAAVGAGAVDVEHAVTSAEAPASNALRTKIRRVVGIAYIVWRYWFRQP